MPRQEPRGIPHRNCRISIGATRPDSLLPPINLYYFRDRFYDLGIDRIETSIGEVRIYNREKTICDVFRYRNKLGEDIALEGLRNYVNSKGANISILNDYAEKCQVKTVIAPYLKALLAQ